MIAWLSSMRRCGIAATFVAAVQGAVFAAGDSERGDDPTLHNRQSSTSFANTAATMGPGGKLLAAAPDGVSVLDPRRQAFYSDLKSGNYRFRVIASNNSGVWNAAGASAAFSIAPAYHQTAWFRILIGTILAGAVWGAYRWRVRTLAARLAEVQKENRQRRQAEEALRRSEARKGAVLNAALDCVIAMDGRGRILDFNPAAECTFGVFRDDAIGRDLADLIIPPAMREAHRRGIARFLATGESNVLGKRIELSAMRAGGHEFPVELAIAATRLGEEWLFTAHLRDITERKAAEQELRSRQDMLDLAQRSARAVAFEWRRGPPMRGSPWTTSWNMHVSAEFEEMFGVKPGSFDGSFESWKRLVCPDDWASVKQGISSAYETGEMSLEYRVIGASGEPRWLESKGRVLFDADGQAERIVGFALDVTAKHQTQDELRRLEHKLRQAQRLEAMGTLAGAIAHDFNNILGAILGYGEMALRGAPEGTRLRRDLDSILVAGERGRALVDRVLAFSRSSVGERVVVHLEKVVREALDLIEARLPQGVCVVANLQAGCAAVVADPTQVHQVVMNLGTNGVQSMRAGGTLAVSVEVIRSDVARSATIGTLAVGEYLRLTVADKGDGIPREIIDRIFDPFFTTKEAGVGTGLGLSLVHSIVLDLGGAMDVSSELNAGSIFTVFLPRVGDAVETTENSAPALPNGNGECVLIVDDEELLVGLAARTLEELGYVPVSFTSGTAALAAFRDDPARFDAMITDERMPGMSGSALIREVRGLRRELPVLLMSGYVGGGLMEAAREAGADDVLKKPLSAHDLALGLARVLQK